MAQREIVGFERDEDEEWTARLRCGHSQHLRHRPPWQLREWVLSEEGRAQKLGSRLDCRYCDMPALPESARVYRQTRVFDEHTVPAGLLSDHRTKAETWGRIVVLEGRLLYQIEEPAPDSWVLRPGVEGIIAPETAHRVRPQGRVRFRVEFLRVSP